MSNKLKNIDIKNHTHYIFNDVINIKIFDPNKAKIKFHTKFTYCTGYVTIKHLKYVKIISVNPFYHYQQSKWIL